MKEVTDTVQRFCLTLERKVGETAWKFVLDNDGQPLKHRNLEDFSFHLEALQEQKPDHSFLFTTIDVPLDPCESSRTMGSATCIQSPEILALLQEAMAESEAETISIPAPANPSHN